MNLSVGLLLVAVTARGQLARGHPQGAAALAALPLLAGAVLTAYVFGEDSYRGNGISRWDAYRSPGGALGPMFVLSVGLMAVSAFLLAYAGLRGRNRLFRWTALAAGITALLLLTTTTLGFSLN